jgi:RNA polymerase sigma-70 factor (ECF subfamily)
MDERPDDLLVDEARRGSLEAFSELARRHQQRIYRLVYGMTRNHSDADDLTQEAFLTAYRAIGSFKRNSSFSTWVYRIAVNLSLNFLRKRGRDKLRTKFHENLPYADENCDSAFSPEGSSIRGELQGRLAAAVETLPPPFKASFLLVVDQGMSHAEAARALGCSENTVSWRMHKARKLLQAKLKPFLGGVRP